MKKLGYLDGDGLPELLALERRGYAHLYANDGTGGFKDEITRMAGLDKSFLATGAMFVDLDGDRDKDLILTAEFDTPHVFENMGHCDDVERLAGKLLLDQGARSDVEVQLFSRRQRRRPVGAPESAPS